LPKAKDHPEAVAGRVAEAAGDVADLDDPVDGFGAAIVRASGGEVGQELLGPGRVRPRRPISGPGQAGDP